MNRPRRVATVADLIGGEIVRLDMGLVRITGRLHGGGRWARFVNRDGSESRTPFPVHAEARVLEVVLDRIAQAAGGGKDEETDPLLRGRGR